MTADEIRELMRLNDWPKARLAAELGLGENIVHKWLEGTRNPGGAARVLMLRMLADARKSKRAKAAV